MKKLTKSEYNKIIKAKILVTGLYNGRSVEESEDDNELFDHLHDIKKDYKKGIITLFNADAEIAYNFLKFLDDDELADIDDLYGSRYENQQDLDIYFRGY